MVADSVNSWSTSRVSTQVDSKDCDRIVRMSSAGGYINAYLCVCTSISGSLVKNDERRSRESRRYLIDHGEGLCSNDVCKGHVSYQTAISSYLTLLVIPHIMYAILLARYSKIVLGGDWSLGAMDGAVTCWIVGRR